MGRKLKIYQAGYATGENSWEVVAIGEDIEMAREELQYMLDSGEYNTHGLRYVEGFYYEDEDVKKERQ